MRANFPKALSHLLVLEGGYSNHPSDPGGVTLNGIIQRVYDAYRRRKGLQPRPLTPNMEKTAEWQRERDDIYRSQYWNAVKGDDLPSGLDIVMFDGAVNSGSSQAVKWLQRALLADGLYHGPIDGDCGISTMAAVQAHPDHDQLIAGVLSRRLGMLQNLRTWPVFGKGWSRRIASVRSIGQAWASGSVGPQPLKVADIGGNAKGYAGDVALALFDPQAGTTTAAGSTSLGVIIQGWANSVQPLLGTSDFINKLFLFLTALTAVIAIIGAVSAWWSTRRNKNAQRAIDGDIVAALPTVPADEVTLVPPSGDSSVRRASVAPKRTKPKRRKARAYAP